MLFGDRREGTMLWRTGKHLEEHPIGMLEKRADRVTLLATDQMAGFKDPIGKARHGLKEAESEDAFMSLGDFIFSGQGRWTPQQHNPKKIQVSVQLPSYNRDTIAKELLESVCNSFLHFPDSYQWSIVVAEDGGSCLEYLQNLAQYYNLLPALRACGFLGIDVFKPDCAPTGGNIGQMRQEAWLKGLERHKAEYIVILDDNGKLRPWAITKAITWLADHPDASGVSRYIDVFTAGEEPVFEMYKVCENYSVLRAAALESVGGWDPRIAGWEGTDLGLMFYFRGWKHYVIRNCGATSRREEPGGLLSDEINQDIPHITSVFLQKYPGLFRVRKDGLFVRKPKRMERMREEGFVPQRG